MLTYFTEYKLDPDSWSDDLEMQLHMKELFPEWYTDSNRSDSIIGSLAYNTGKGIGKAKNFFSKTETKTATLIAYWAADTLVAATLILTTTNPVALTAATALLILHTYATFSVVSEITK